MPEAWPLCTDANWIFETRVFGELEKKLYCFARQRGTQRAHASQTCVPTQEELVRSYSLASAGLLTFLKNCSSSCDKCSASVITPHLLQRQVLTTTFSSKSKLKPISTMLLLGIVRNWDIAGGPGGNRFLYLSFISNIISHIYFYPKLSAHLENVLWPS